MENQTTFSQLFKKFLADECNPEEFRQVIDVLSNQGEDSEISRLLREHLLKSSSTDQADPVLHGLLQEHLDKILEHESFEQPVIRDKPAKVFIWRRLVAAASIVIAVSTGLFWYFGLLQPADPVIANGAANVDITDIAPPARAHAVITLEDGRTIILDSVHNGSLTSNLVKVNADRLSYNGKVQTKIEYHTLSLPRGSRPLTLELADGSKVWINAASSLRYPTIFTGDERVVEITGEAYFEVAKSPGRKFIVKANGVRTEVLGTHFNVNAYSDESHLKITLLEGSVHVQKEGGASGILVPGQQAQFAANGKLSVTDKAPVAEIMAWKNGLFLFDGKDIETIMRELSRWYDVDVTYKGLIPAYPFVAKIPRNVPVSELLKLLELTDLVHFKIEDKKITVMP